MQCIVCLQCAQYICLYRYTAVSYLHIVFFSLSIFMYRKLFVFIFFQLSQGITTISLNTHSHTYKCTHVFLRLHVCACVFVLRIPTTALVFNIYIFWFVCTLHTADDGEYNLFRSRELETPPPPQPRCYVCPPRRQYCFFKRKKTY